MFASAGISYHVNYIYAKRFITDGTRGERKTTHTTFLGTLSFSNTHLCLGDGTLVPSGLLELLPDVELLEGIAHQTGTGSMREAHAELRQMQMVHGVLLTGNTAGGAIDQYLRIAREMPVLVTKRNTTETKKTV